MTMSLGADQVLEALNVYEKDLPSEYHYSLLKCFESAQRTTMQNLENSISKHFDSEIYILSLTMEKTLALK